MTRRSALLVLGLVSACASPSEVATDAGLDAAPGLDSATPDAGLDTSALCPDPDRDGDGVARIDCGGTDCDDGDSRRFPGNLELCDALDQDCDPTTLGERDLDRDGFHSAQCCNPQPSGPPRCDEDCDDARRGTNPNVPEVCDRLDNDCDGMVDEEATVQAWIDADRDGFGDPTMEAQACAGTPGYASNDRDCDDTNRSRTEGRRDVGDRVDNDCDGMLDEDASDDTVWYRDADGDRIGAVSSGTTRARMVPAGYALDGDDCDDTERFVSPVAPERCNGRDDDCDDKANYEIAVNDTEDDDGDGVPDSACNQSEQDCDDRDPEARPGATEQCNGRDDDCDATIDEGCPAPGVDGGVLPDAALVRDAIAPDAWHVDGDVFVPDAASAIDADLPSEAGSPDGGVDASPDGIDARAGDAGRCAAGLPIGATRELPRFPLPGTAAHPRSHQVLGTGADETVLDCVTGLEWQRSFSPTAEEWAAADTYCASLTLAGHTDWRMPTRAELVTLVDYVVVGAVSIDLTAFPGTPAAEFWSASTLAGVSNPLVVNFGGGASYVGAIARARVRCVRDEGGTDGSSQYAVFATEVRDQRTGLIWQRSVSADLSQADARMYCEARDPVGTWRLPEVAELLSIVDVTRASPRIDPTAFPGTGATAYWSSTVQAGSPGYAWSVLFVDGSSFGDYVAYTSRVRCVR